MCTYKPICYCTIQNQIKTTGNINILYCHCSLRSFKITYTCRRHVSGSLSKQSLINPLNAQLNPICHLMVLLGDLTFMGPCIVSIFQYISNKMQRYTVYLYLETALYVSSVTSTHHQERIQQYLQHLVFVTLLLLPAPIAADSSNGVTNTRCCR
jgi:hypothetical protein